MNESNWTMQPKAIPLPDYVDEIRQHGELGMPYVVPMLSIDDLTRHKLFPRIVEAYVELGWYQPSAPFHELKNRALRRPEFAAGDPVGFQRWKDYDPVRAFLASLAEYRTDAYHGHIDRVRRQRAGK